LWGDLGPLLGGVRDTGKTFFADDRPFYIERHGYGETAYFDVSYSAVPDADGSVAGVLCIVSETTKRVKAESAPRESEAKLRELNQTLEQRIVQRTRELEHTHEALRQAQKMEAVGQLTGALRTTSTIFCRPLQAASISSTANRMTRTAFAACRRPD
jgi:PAS domain-containing protein